MENIKVVLFADDINMLVIDKDCEVLQSKLRRVMTQSFGFKRINYQ